MKLRPRPNFARLTTRPTIGAWIRSGLFSALTCVVGGTGLFLFLDGPDRRPPPPPTLPGGQIWSEAAPPERPSAALGQGATRKRFPETLASASPTAVASTDAVQASAVGSDGKADPQTAKPPASVTFSPIELVKDTPQYISLYVDYVYTGPRDVRMSVFITDPLTTPPRPLALAQTAPADVAYKNDTAQVDCRFVRGNLEKLGMDPSQSVGFRFVITDNQVTGADVGFVDSTFTKACPESSVQRPANAPTVADILAVRVVAATPTRLDIEVDVTPTFAERGGRFQGWVTPDGPFSSFATGGAGWAGTTTFENYIRLDPLARGTQLTHAIRLCISVQFFDGRECHEFPYDHVWTAP